MLEVNIDGASAGNPGPSGAGIFIKNNETKGGKVRKMEGRKNKSEKTIK